MNKKFTILTASYNCAKYLPELAESVVKQTYRPIEHIIVNDKSTDNTLKVIEDIKKIYKKHDIEFKFINSSKKLYCGSAYRLALKNATGNYFGVLDSDDMLEPFACEYISEIYEKYPQVAWIYTQYNKYNKKANRIIKKGFCSHPGKNESLLSMGKKRIHKFSHWRTFSDRLPNKNKIFQKGLRCCVDKNMGYRMEEQGIGMFVNKICYKYRARSRKEKPIVHSEPLRKTWSEVINITKKRRRRKKIKIFPILVY